MSDDALRIDLIDSAGQNKRVEKAFPGVPLFVVAGELEPVPSWWMLDLVKARTPADTVETYRKGLELWLGALHLNGIAWHDATTRTAQMFVDALVARGNAQGTIAVRMAAVLRFYRWAFNQGFLRAVPFTKEALSIPKGRTKSVRSHSTDEFERIASAHPAATSGVRRRDELIFECGRFMGLRRSEVAGLKVADFEGLDADGTLNIVWTDPSCTKGGKSRAVLVPRSLLKKILAYIEIYRSEIVDRRRHGEPRWSPPPNLFLTARGTAVTRDYVSDTWGRLAKAAGIESRFHNNRSSFATHVADAASELGHLPLPVVKDLLGHASEATSQRYVQYAELRSRLLSDAQIVNDGYDAEAIT